MTIGLTKISNTGIESAESVAVETLEWASDTGGTVLNASSGEWFQVVNIQVAVTFNAAATGDAEVHVRKSVDDGTTEDTPEEGTYLGTIGCSAGNTVTRTFQAYDFDYLEFLKTGQNRSINRQKLSWGEIESELESPGSLRNRIFSGFQAMLRARKSTDAFDPSGEMQILSSNRSVFALVRFPADRSGYVICLVNVGPDISTVDFLLEELPGPGKTAYRDIISGETVIATLEHGRLRFQLPGFGVFWLQ